jgi:hypothetical protein
MSISWKSDVKSAGKLTVFNGITGGKWATLFSAALESFNKLNKRHGLGVKLVPSKSKEDANVVMQTSAGSASFDYDGTTYSIAFDGKALKGKTRLVHPSGDIEKAFIYLPAEPLVNTPQGQRGLGVNAMKVVAVHELIHACGLEDGDHTETDIFYGNPVPAIGDSAGGDQIMLISKTGNVKFPPMLLSPATVSKIKSVW